MPFLSTESYFTSEHIPAFNHSHLSILIPSTFISFLAKNLKQVLILMLIHQRKCHRFLPAYSILIINSCWLGGCFVYFPCVNFYTVPINMRK